MSASAHQRLLERASERQIGTLNARVLLQPPETREEGLSKVAIPPYPKQYSTKSKLRGGCTVTIRPVRPEDEPLMVDFHQTLSEQSVHNRYFSAIGLETRVAHQRLRRICGADYDREIALIAIEGRGDFQKIVAVARLSRVLHEVEAEFAIIVGDPWQRQGLGQRLLELLVKIGRDQKIARITGHILPGNTAMLHISRKCGFTLHRSGDGSEVLAEKHL